MRRALVTAVLAAALAAPAGASAQPARITIVSLFDPIAYGQKAFVNGQLVGDDTAGQVVTLQASPFPFTAWSDIAQITTDERGFYSFLRRPIATTHYRTMWNGQLMSDSEVQVQVIPRLAFKAVAAGKRTVRYSGTLAPAHADEQIEIQRQTRSGAWTTIVRPRLRGGATFSGRLHARHTIRLRAFFPSDGDHLAAASAPATVAR